MKIVIQSPDKRPIKIAFPTRMLFNNLTATIGGWAINKYVATDEVNLSSADMRRLMKEINRIKHKYPDLLLVDVEASDSGSVKITL